MEGVVRRDRGRGGGRSRRLLLVVVGRRCRRRTIVTEIDAGPGVRVFLAVGRFGFERELEFADRGATTDDVFHFLGVGDVHSPASGGFADREFLRSAFRHRNVEGDLGPHVRSWRIADPTRLELRFELVLFGRDGRGVGEDRGSRDGRRDDDLHLVFPFPFFFVCLF